MGIRKKKTAPKGFHGMTSHGQAIPMTFHPSHRHDGYRWLKAPDLLEVAAVVIVSVQLRQLCHMTSGVGHVSGYHTASG
ncbi:hypothetical protein ElyMa_003590600 [Elysia marginata]|uniref:Uncharacterized protein n=1 Tax=Elysia marginata TaxID=1093978 RepID=A0AAV4EPU4_9GAST|nr:hypothetical protein ElyMa_003590600 [Elysia marginata]